jgi:hypothetical protein
MYIFPANANAHLGLVPYEGTYYKADFAVSRLVPDEMVRALVAVGPPDKVREGIEPIWHLADSICVSLPTYALAPEKLQYYSDMIASTFPPDSL